MIILDSTSQSLTLVTTAPATTQVDWDVSYVDVTTTTYTPTGTNGVGTGSSPVTIVPAPSSSHQIQIKKITVYNADSANITITIQKLVTATNYVLCKVTIAPNETLQYVDGYGFSAIDNESSRKYDYEKVTAISAGTNIFNSGVIFFANNNAITFGMSNNSVVTASVSNYDWKFWDPPWRDLTPNIVQANSGSINLSMQRIFIPYPITVTRLDIMASLTVAASTTGTWSISVGVYTRNASTLNLVTASSTYSGLAYNTTGGTSDTGAYSGISGMRFRTFGPQSWQFNPGEYWVGFINSITNPAGTTGSVTFAGHQTVTIFPYPGLSNNDVGHMGIFATSTGAFPSSMAFSDIVFATTGATATLIMRQPYFRMFGI